MKQAERRIARVKPGLSHAHHEAGDLFEATPSEWRDFGDKFEEVMLEELVEYIESGFDQRSTTATVEGDSAQVGDSPVVDDGPISTAVEPQVTPDAVRVAEELGVDLVEIEGSGQEGRIIVKDVRAAARTRDQTTAAAAREKTEE